MRPCFPELFFGTLIALGVAFADPPKESLSKSLTFHASFDDGFEADFSRGDKVCYLPVSGGLEPAKESDVLKRSEEAGRFGAGLWFVKKSELRPFFHGKDIFGYNAESWSASVSVWLRLDPDRDLEPGYCDPLQIVAGSTSTGFIFLEWSKDHKPRKFRYAIRPLIELWNPKSLLWEDVSPRPAVELDNAKFSRDSWTHVVFTFHKINEGKNATASLYLNGEHKGNIEGWDMRFGWEPDALKLILGAAYVGHLDELSAFDRSLTAEEVKALYNLENGVSELYKK